jgi:TRAP-type C4-dicarboxylate transport system permease large subunit
MALNRMTGTLTPPIGIVLFVEARVAELPFERVTRGTVPFLVPLVSVLGLITVFPRARALPAPARAGAVMARRRRPMARAGAARPGG